MEVGVGHQTAWPHPLPLRTRRPSGLHGPQAAPPLPAAVPMHRTLHPIRSKYPSPAPVSPQGQGRGRARPHVTGSLLWGPAPFAASILTQWAASPASWASGWRLTTKSSQKVLREHTPCCLLACTWQATSMRGCAPRSLMCCGVSWAQGQTMGPPHTCTHTCRERRCPRTLPNTAPPPCPAPVSVSVPVQTGLRGCLPRPTGLASTPSARTSTASRRGRTRWVLGRSRVGAGQVQVQKGQEALCRCGRAWPEDRHPPPRQGAHPACSAREPPAGSACTAWFACGECVGRRGAFGHNSNTSLCRTPPPSHIKPHPPPPLQAFWEEKGWIDPQDPRGWFQW